MTDLYDRIGAGYASVRRPDPRIAARIEAALAGAEDGVNVGAGAGSYESRGWRCVAIEPSLAMIRQRLPGSAPCVRGLADALPIADRGVAAAMAVLTIHHWPNPAAGIRELMRVARERILLLTWDPDFADAFWMTRHYLPEIAALDRARFPAIDTLLGWLRPLRVRVETIAIPHDCTDGFYGAYWRRPAEYLEPTVQAGISCLRQLPPEVLARGVAALAADLAADRFWPAHAELAAETALDLGYRLIVAT